MISVHAPVDLRSDTVTRPTAAMRRAMADAEVGDDDRDGDPTTRRLEAMIAERLGKERALFFPSGSMGNLASIWLHTQPGTEVFVDADAHVVHWEIAGVAGLCGAQIRTVQSTRLVYNADDLRASIRPPALDAPDPSLVCVENTHNGAGGVVTTLPALQAIAAVAREHQLPVHLDGARLWNASAATGTSLADFAACADTLMVAFSKGLGAPVGAAVAGSAAAVLRLHKIRKRFGGGMRQSGILAAAALHGLEHHLARLSEDHESARELGRFVDGVSGAKIVAPDTNILMIDLPAARATDIVARAAALGVRVSAWSPTRIRAVTHLDAPMEAIQEAGPLLRQAIERSLA